MNRFYRTAFIVPFVTPLVAIAQIWVVVFDTSRTVTAEAVRVLQRNEKLVCEQRSTVLLESLVEHTEERLLLGVTANLTRILYKLVDLTNN